MLDIEMQLQAASQKYVCPRCSHLLGPAWQVVKGKVVCKKIVTSDRKSVYFDVRSRQFIGNKTWPKARSIGSKPVKRQRWSVHERRQCAFQQNYCCAACKQLLLSVWEADHVIPLHLHGTNELSNCQILCSNCHARKTQYESLQRAKRKND